MGIEIKQPREKNIHIMDYGHQSIDLYELSKIIDDNMSKGATLCEVLPTKGLIRFYRPISKQERNINTIKELEKALDQYRKNI